MYSASTAFHNAVKNNAPQIALLIFSDNTFISNEDIVMENGLELSDYFQMNADFEVGQVLSNELEFTLFNDNQLLNNYGFGEFEATIGAMISSGSYSSDDTVHIKVSNDVFQAFNTTPYLKKNGSSAISQPSFAPKSMIYYDGFVYCFGADGRGFKLNASTGSGSAYTPNAFMKHKMSGLQGYGFSYDKSTRKMVVYYGDKTETYEFVPLGKFVADRPNVSDDIRISFVCNDFMVKFDKEMISLTYPITFKGILDSVCNSVGITNGMTTFINSTATLTEKPDEFDNATMRDVIKWIAEASGTVAKIDRDGVFRLKWFGSSSIELDESNYKEFRPYWYEVPKVNKLVNRTTNGGADASYGSGTNAYLVQDNPLLKGVT